MPVLSVTKTYQDGNILAEADLDAIRNSLETFFNTTKINDTNVQDAGITRASKLKVGTANYVLINASDGTMTEEASLAVTRGGTGIALTLTSADPSKVLAVKSDYSGFELVPVPASTLSRLYSFSRFT